MQRPNTNVLLSVLQEGRSKGVDRRKTVALLGRKRRKEKQESGRMV